MEWRTSVLVVIFKTRADVLSGSRGMKLMSRTRKLQQRAVEAGLSGEVAISERRTHRAFASESVSV